MFPGRHFIKRQLLKHNILLFTLVLIVTACTPSSSVQATSTPISATATPFTLSSSSFGEGQTIPVDYTCKGTDISPALTWTEPPAGTQSFVIIMDDPGASWTHWTLFNIPASTRNLKEALPTDSELSDGSVQGKTSFGRSGYGGPCPPSGIHNYFFKLYALDTTLSLQAKGFSFEIIDAMEGHILATAELTGTFPSP
jgi:Raf kinase inhibitor-like YbhB/YbcL family protein